VAPAGCCCYCCHHGLLPGLLARPLATLPLLLLLLSIAAAAVGATPSPLRLTLLPQLLLW
jgi:hypothetical protein